MKLSDKIEPFYGEGRIKVCCRTCVSLKSSTYHVFNIEKVCTNKKAKPIGSITNNDECYCTQWKPSRDAVRLAIIAKQN